MLARRLGLKVIAALCVWVSTLALAGAAWGGFTHKLEGEFGSFSGSIGVAVEQFSGDVYVVDSNANTVKKFDSAGNPVAGWSLGAMTGPSAGGLNFPYGAAVDQATGDLYIADYNNGTVDKFDSSGAFVLSFTGSATPAGSFTPTGLATDSAGNVYVADIANGVIDKFDSTGKYLATFGAGVLSSTNGVAVDSSGDVYATANSYQLIELDASGNCVNSCTPVDQSGSLGVGIDPVSGHIYSADNGSIREYDSSGVFIDSFGEGHLSGTYGVAVNGALGKVYASNLGGSAADIFGLAVVIPDVTTGPATGITTTNATLAGTVNPDGVPITSCTFEYSRYFIGYEVNSVPCASSPGSGSSAVAVSANATGLTPNTPYSYRLIASNTNGTIDGEALTFTTLSAPLIDEQWLESVSNATVTVDAKINPKEYATVYFLEYGQDTSYGSRIPASPAAIGAGNEDVAVSQSLAGLEGGTTYHYRFVATNANGTTDGRDMTFKTSPTPAAVTDSCPNAQVRGLQAAQYLPDCRAYEMVSPPEKDGGNISADQTAIAAAVDGNAVQYVSITGFADAQGSNAFGTAYIAERGTGEGWMTHAITPSQSPPIFPIARVASYTGYFSPDLNTGVYLSISPFQAMEPNVVNVPNVYLRTDLLKAGRGTYQLLSGCPECTEPLPARKVLVFGEIDPAVAGASEDLSHVIFETTGDLTGNTLGLGEQPKLYESVNGVVRLVGILPGGAVAEESVAGQGAIVPAMGGFGRLSMHTPHTISADGSRIVFTAGPLVSASSAGLASGSSSEAYAGNLYLRENGATSVKLNASERSTAEPEQPALYMNASKDDSKIFFVTNEALNDETTHPGLNLYMYDVNAPEHHHLTLIARQSTEGGQAGELWVSGVSDDGSYVYFSMPAPGRGKTLYVWHEGTTRLIAEGGSEPDWGEESIQLYGNEDLFRVSPDGKHVVFESNSRSTAESAGYDNCLAQQSCEYGSNLGKELYLYDYETGKLTCVSCDPSGERPVGNASFMTNSVDITIIGLAKTQRLNNALTENGDRVFFDTPDPLVRQDTNGKRDVYEYDARTGTVSLVSSGRSSDDSFFVEATPDGSDVFFTTSEQLVKADVDGNFDLYDARENGGIASQNVGPPAQCESDDCQGPAKAVVTFSLPSSVTFQGQGNPAAKRVVSARAKSPTKAERLKRALRACHKKHGKRRRACERSVRKRFRTVKSSVRAAATAARGR